MSPPTPEAGKGPFNPFESVGGETRVRELVERFYDEMEAHEPELTALHPCEDGRVTRAARDRFAVFLIGWLGGPDEYVRRHGHPRLRMRHAHVPVNTQTRDAWVGSMRRAHGASFTPHGDFAPGHIGRLRSACCSHRFSN